MMGTMDVMPLSTSEMEVMAVALSGTRLSALHLWDEYFTFIRGRFGCELNNFINRTVGERRHKERKSVSSPACAR